MGLSTLYQIFAFSDLTSPLMSVGRGISQSLQRVLTCELVVFIELGSSYLLMLLSTKTTIRPLMEYCCHIWAGAPACHLSLLESAEAYC